MDLVIAAADDAATIVEVADGAPGTRMRLALPDLPGWVASRSPDTRWVWADSGDVYPTLLAAGVRVHRAVDLRLVRAILRRAGAVAHTDYARAPSSAWDEGQAGHEHASQPHGTAEATLFDLTRSRFGIDECVAEHLAQQACLAQADDGGRLSLLCHAESVGGLIAQELNHAGVPFSAEVHDSQLTALLGQRDRYGGRPATMAQLCTEVQRALDAPTLNPDSPADLITALRRAGLDVSSTRQWELERLDHPVIEPLLQYKKLSRLHTANGWAWLQAWVHEGRFRPDWVAGGVVTGRWASRGGGALQLPKQIRSAVRADPGWKLVVADAAQLEPRVLAAMSGDERMARAAAGADLYQALVDQGVVDTRQHAKVAMLGAMYGATTGEAGALMPQLQRAYPRAIGVVESAARAGERGDQVRPWLGRTSPPPSSWWREAQEAAQQPGSGPTAERRARQAARDWGRFTRNFVVQGTAAEWALCWLADLRNRLWRLGASGPVEQRPHLVFFLHDEVVVHTPEHLAGAVVEEVRRAAATAGRLLFGTFPVDFPLDVSVVASWADAG